MKWKIKIRLLKYTLKYKDSTLYTLKYKDISWTGISKKKKNIQ